MWRCYSLATLTADGASYLKGRDYCSRHTQLQQVLNDCERAGVMAATVDVGGSAKLQPLKPKPKPMHRPPPIMPSAAESECCRVPTYTKQASPAPRYQHTPSFMKLPPSLVLPRLEDCAAELVDGALFWAASLYTSSYQAKALRLVASCEAWGVCCRPALMPEGALEGVNGENKEGSYALRHRLIASKPLFILEVLRRSALPLAWMDVDLEYHSFPTLFTPAGWSGEAVAARDVILWNWQSNVTNFRGRRLKMASGIAWFNKTAPAEALLLAWAEAMAYEGDGAGIGSNVRAPDDQTMDLLVNDDGWIDRASFGWLPASYLRMMPRHKDIVAVIDHDRGMVVSGKGKNSPDRPWLPPHASDP